MSFIPAEPPRPTALAGDRRGRAGGSRPPPLYPAPDPSAAPVPKVVELALVRSLLQERAAPREAKPDWTSSVAATVVFSIGLGVWSGMILWVLSLVLWPL